MDFLGLAIAIFNVSILYLRTWFTTTYIVPLQNIDLHFQNNVYCNPGVPVLFNAQPRNIYSKQVLYSLSPSSRSYVLRSDVIQTLRRNKINAIKKTRRSRRGGKSQIKVIALNHNRACYPPRSVDITNLIKIDTHKAFIEKADNLTFIYLNARSCRNKTLEINDLILKKNADLLFISETWLSKDESVFTNEMLPNSYDILSQPRLSRSGGAVAIIYRASLKVITISISSCSTFEACCLKIVTPSNSLLCSCIIQTISQISLRISMTS